MKLSSFLFSVLCCAAFALAQTAPPAPATPAPGTPAATAAPPKARGPEAVAAVDPNRVVATIDGKQITAKQALDMLKPFPPDQRKQAESNLSNFVQTTYTREQFAQAAKKLNLDQQSPLKEQLDLARDNMLAQAYIAHISQTAGNTASADPQKFYDSHPGDFDTVNLSGIFVQFNPPGTPAATPGSRTEAQAREKADDLEKKLKAGGDFAALARSDSDNQGTATKGGDLGPFTLGDPQIPADIKTAIVKLEPGQYTEPIHIPNAFLIVKLTSRSKATFEQARAQIVRRMQQDSSQAAVKQELDKYKITVQDSDFFDTARGGASNIPSLQRPATPAPAKPQP